MIYPRFQTEDLLGKSQKHLKDINETYGQHMIKALGYAFTLQRLVPVLIIHSLVPALFTCTASNAMKGILEDRCCSDNNNKQMEFDFDID